MQWREGIRFGSPSAIYCFPLCLELSVAGIKLSALQVESRLRTSLPGADAVFNQPADGLKLQMGGGGGSLSSSRTSSCMDVHTVRRWLVLLLSGLNSTAATAPSQESEIRDCSAAVDINDGASDKFVLQGEKDSCCDLLRKACTGHGISCGAC